MPQKLNALIGSVCCWTHLWQFLCTSYLIIKHSHASMERSKTLSLKWQSWILLAWTFLFLKTKRCSDQRWYCGYFECKKAQSVIERCLIICSRVPWCIKYQRQSTSSTKILVTESTRAFLYSVCKERCLCPSRLAGPLLHPPQLCLLGYYTFTTQSALSKRSWSNPRKSRLHWRKWLCSVHKCQPCVLT